MGRRRFSEKEYPSTQNYTPQKDENGHVVRQLSQLPRDVRDVFIKSDDGANWAGYVDPSIPQHIKEIQDGQNEFIDHLFSHIND